MIFQTRFNTFIDDVVRKTAEVAEHVAREAAGEGCRQIVEHLETATRHVAPEVCIFYVECYCLCLCVCFLYF